MFCSIERCAQHGAQPERGYNTVLFFQFSGPRPVSFTLAELYGHAYLPNRNV